MQAKLPAKFDCCMKNRRFFRLAQRSLRILTLRERDWLPNGEEESPLSILPACPVAGLVRLQRSNPGVTDSQDRAARACWFAARLIGIPSDFFGRWHGPGTGLANDGINK